jgi:hypothetical protein
MVVGNLACTSNGCIMIIPAPGFDPEATLEAVAKERCMSLYGVGARGVEARGVEARVQAGYYRDSRMTIDSGGRVMPWATEDAFIVPRTMLELVAFWLAAL